MTHDQHGAHGFAGLQRYQVADVFALAGGADAGNFVDLEPVDAAGVGENQNVGVSGGDEQMLDEILVTRLHAGAAGAAAALHAVSGDGGALEIAAVAYGDCYLLVGDQVFEHDLGSFVFNAGAALVAVELSYFFELFDDDGAQLLFRAEDGFEVGDVVASETEFFGDFVDREPGQAVQLQLENGLGLDRGERPLGIQLGGAAGDVDVDFLASEIGDQGLAGVSAIGAGAHDGNDVVEMIERGDVAFENVLALFGLHQQVSGAAADDVDAVIDEVLDGGDQAHFLGLAVDHGEEDHAETFLHGSVFEELVEDELGFAAAL